MDEQAVERETVVPAPPEEVWNALTEEALLEQWLAPDVELEPQEGGLLRVRTEEGEQRLGRVESVEEGRRLAFVWQREGDPETRVELTVEAVPDGSRVVVVESGAAAGRGWGPRLAALARASSLALV